MISMRFRSYRLFPSIFYNQKENTLQHPPTCRFVHLTSSTSQKEIHSIDFSKGKIDPSNSQFFLRFSKIFRNQFKTSSKRSMARHFSKNMCFFYEMLPRFSGIHLDHLAMCRFLFKLKLGNFNFGDCTNLVNSSKLIAPSPRS